MFTLLYDESKDDPVANVLLSRPDEFDVQAFSVRKLITSRIDGFRLENETNPLVFVDNQRVDFRASFLVNRLVRIHPESLAGFGNEQNLFRVFKFACVFLSGLIRKFPYRTGGPGHGCLAGNYFPLNLQWHMLQQTSTSLSVPKFHYAFGYGSQRELVDPVACDPNDFTSLLSPPSRNEQGTPIWHGFSYQRPQGRPIVCAVVSDRFLMRYADSGGMVSDTLQKALAPEIYGLIKLFEINVAEFIFFESADYVTFGCFTHTFDLSRTFNDFPDFVMQGLLDFRHTTMEDSNRECA